MFMNKITLLLLSLMAGCLHTASAQMVINNGTTVSVSTGTAVTLSDDINVDGGATLVSDGAILLQSGNFINNGTATLTNNSVLAYDGIGPQQLISASPITIGSIVLNNPTGLNPANTVTITNSLILNQGSYYADTAHPVHFANTASDPVEQNSSHIEGWAILDPIAIGTNALSFLGCNIQAGDDLGTVSILRNSGPNATINIGSGSSISQSWLISNSNIAPNPSRDISFSWLSVFDNGRDLTSMYLYGSQFPFSHFVNLNDTAQDVSGSDPRVFSMAGLSNFNRLFTLSDNIPVGVATVKKGTAKVSVFPNPFGSVVNLNITKDDNDPVEIRIVDMTGKTVMSGKYNAGRTAVITLNELANLTVGSYFVQVYNDHFGKNIKIVKTN